MLTYLWACRVRRTRAVTAGLAAGWPAAATNTLRLAPVYRAASTASPLMH